MEKGVVEVTNKAGDTKDHCWLMMLAYVAQRFNYIGHYTKYEGGGGTFGDGLITPPDRNLIKVLRLFRIALRLQKRCLGEYGMKRILPIDHSYAGVEEILEDIIYHGKKGRAAPHYAHYVPWIVCSYMRWFCKEKHIDPERYMDAARPYCSDYVLNALKPG